MYNNNCRKYNITMSRNDVTGSSLSTGRKMLVGEWINSYFFHYNYPQMRCPWPRYQTANCSPGTAAKTAAQCSWCVCSKLCLCTWMGGTQSTNSEYGTQYLATCYVTFIFIYRYLSKSCLTCLTSTIVHYIVSPEIFNGLMVELLTSVRGSGFLV